MKGRKFNPSLITFICLGYVFGIIAGSCIKVSFGIIFIGVLFSLLVIFTCRYKKAALSVFILLSVLMGMLYTQVKDEKNQNNIGYFYPFSKGVEIVVRGVIKEDVVHKKVFHTDRYSFKFKCEEIFVSEIWQNVSGEILVQMYRDENLKYGDYLELTGKLHRPFEYSDNDRSSYVKYLSRHGIDFILSMKKDGKVKRLNHAKIKNIKSLVYPWRKKFAQTFDENLTANESGIMRAVILGDRTQMPHHIRELFIRTGTAHVLAMSGLHVGVVAGIFMLLVHTLPFGFRIKYVLLIGMLFFFVFLTGMRPSIIRALIMTILILSSNILEKDSDYLNNAFLAAFVILLINPLYLFDIGFQLSFGCIFSIIFLMSVSNQQTSFGELGGFGKVNNYILDSLAVSTAIWIGVTGISAYYFNIITPVSILVNLWAIPLIGIIVSLGLGLLAVSVLMPPLVPYFALIIKILLNFFVATLFLAEKIPFGHFTIKNITYWHIILYYSFVGFVIVIIFYFKKCAQSNVISLTKQ